MNDPYAEFEELVRRAGLAPANPDDIWQQRPSLAYIRDAALAGRASKEAVLGAVLARVIAATPPTVVLPNLVGGYGSLNVFVALVGKSGGGKGTAEAVAREIIPDIGDFVEAGVGSGEGIAHLYARRVSRSNDVEQHTSAVLLNVSEIDTLTALGDRRGATLLPELRKAWSGEPLGFAYADPTKRLLIRAHTYRLALIAGVQPGRGGAVMRDADGGTPQRFLWLPVDDPNAPFEQPPPPEPWQWQPPSWSRDHRQIIAVCDAARSEIDYNRVLRLRGQAPEDLDAHALLARLKVAAALALLDSRWAVTDEDWSIAAAVMEISTRTRAGIADELRRAASEQNRARGAAEAERAVVVEEHTQEAAIRRVTQTIKRKLAEAGSDGMTGAEIKRAIAARDRQHFDEAIDRLERAGAITATPAGRGTRYTAGQGAR